MQVLLKLKLDYGFLLFRKTNSPPTNQGSTTSSNVLRQLLYYMLLIWTPVALADFTINHAQVRLVDNAYLLNASLNYTLSKDVIEALDNSITLTMVLTVTVKRERWYMWDETVLTTKHRYQMKYYPLSEQYVLRYLNSGIQDAFPTLNYALSAMGKVIDIPVINKGMVSPDYTYHVYLQSYLDVEALPVPLRTVAYFSSQWHLSSDWYVCPLPPPK